MFIYMQVDNNFFTTRVPIGQFDSLLLSTFPRANRPEVTPGIQHIRTQLQRLGKEGWSMKALIADFHFLLFLSYIMDMSTDVPRICRAVVDLDVPLDEGYELLIRSFADM